jgi:chaperonin GroEL (HSP60 family)
MVSDVIRTSLGPRAMLKMLMDPMGGIVLTNDGNAILREITVKHPAAKAMIEIARTQDEEAGDGTTSVIVLAGEVMAQVLCFDNFSNHLSSEPVEIDAFNYKFKILGSTIFGARNASDYNYSRKF